MINFQNGEVQKVKQYFLQQIAEEIEALKNPDLDDRTTQFYRGRIAMAESFLSEEVEEEEQPEA